VSLGSIRDLPTYTRELPIFKSDTSIAVQCRCGARVPHGGEVVGITTVPASLQSVFHGAIFCSPECVRAFCLESLEILDSLDTPASKAMVTDLHELCLEIATALAMISGNQVRV
jgi:hypothetical protein